MKTWKRRLTACLMLLLALMSVGYVVLSLFLTYRVRFKEPQKPLIQFYNTTPHDSDISLILLPPQNDAYSSLLSKEKSHLSTNKKSSLLANENSLLSTNEKPHLSTNTIRYLTTNLNADLLMTMRPSMSKTQAPSSGAMNMSPGGPRKKYLIYLCDDKRYCFGLGDRQRGIASVYLLAEVTNRTFGLVMTSPSNFTDFYQPYLVNWAIPESELRGKSSIVLEALGPKTDFKLDTVDFNANYTQDVVYIRTNQKFHFYLVKNPFYKDKFPQWALPPYWRLYQNGWMRLMKPTESLRANLNEMLLQIFDVMVEEVKVWNVLNSTGCCVKVKKASMDCNNISCMNKSLTECCGSSGLNIASAGHTDCLNSSCLPPNCSNSECAPGFNQTRCIDKLETVIKNSTDVDRTISLANKLCISPPLGKPLTVTREFIHQSKQYDPVDMNMVCAHIRLGHSKTMPFENNIRNKEGEEKAVWRFLSPYVDKGHHVYLATDSEEVRQEAKRLFGYRLHISTVPIVHIAAVQKGQDKVMGFRLTLTEQLLLSTSCSVLVVSYSGFSMKAAQFRHILQPGYGQLFIYRNGGVFPVIVSSLQ